MLSFMTKEIMAKGCCYSRLLIYYESRTCINNDFGPYTGHATPTPNTKHHRPSVRHTAREFRDVEPKWVEEVNNILHEIRKVG
jgi:hypothetical protein